MPDKLKPCPACGHSPFIESFFSEYTVDRRFKFTCNCGASGPWAFSEHDAATSWNNLPRTPRGTTYDGTPKTLPPIGKIVLVSLYGIDVPQLCKNTGGVNWNKILGRPFEAMCKGDRWWPMPEDR
ncbi:MAG: Lar family restriction alleviation protein [Desulfovibrio sp.]